MKRENSNNNYPNKQNSKKMMVEILDQIGLKPNYKKASNISNFSQEKRFDFNRSRVTKEQKKSITRKKKNRK